MDIYLLWTLIIIAKMPLVSSLNQTWVQLNLYLYLIAIKYKI